MLSKLIEISDGKNLSTEIPANPKRNYSSRRHLNSSKCLHASSSKASSVFQTLPVDSINKSLNFAVRRDENNRILEEN